MTKNRINKLDSLLQHCDSYILDSFALDSSLVTLAQNDKAARIRHTERDSAKYSNHTNITKS